MGGLTAIDLDVAEGQTLSPVQLSIIANFNRYTEISASGRGVQVFALGSIGKGLRHASVEIYSQGRFIALTGNHYGEPRAVAERQEYLDQLVHELRGREGQWRDLYGSQSEADFGYIDMLWFHSRHREQTRRLFRASALGERDKLGAMCRSFTQPGSSGLACHEPGGWHVRSALATGGAPDDGSDYRMAAGPDPRLAALPARNRTTTGSPPGSPATRSSGQ